MWATQGNSGSSRFAWFDSFRIAFPTGRILQGLDSDLTGAFLGNPARRGNFLMVHPAEAYFNQRGRWNELKGLSCLSRGFSEA
jgi:hypothetical protein